MKKQDWTIARSLFLLFLLLDITIIAVWLIFYHEYYDTVAKVVGGIWGAVIAVLTYLKVRRGRSISFPTFIGLLPVRFIIIVYSILIFLFTCTFILWEFPVHVVSIKVEVGDDGKPVQMQWINGDTLKDQTDGEWQIFGIQQNRTYYIVCEPKGYKKQVVPFTPTVWPFHTKRIGGFEKQGGVLEIEYSPDKVSLTIMDSLNMKEFAKNNIHEESPWIIEIPEGNYMIIAEKERHKTDTPLVSLTAFDTTKLIINLPPIPPLLGKLKIKTSPEGMKVYLGGVYTNKLTPCTLKLTPRDYDYQLLLEKHSGERFGYKMEKSIAITNSQTIVIDTLLHRTELYELTIKPMQSNFIYYLHGEEIKVIGEQLELFTILVFKGDNHFLKKHIDTGESFTKTITVNKLRGTLRDF